MQQERESLHAAFSRRSAAFPGIPRTWTAALEDAQRDADARHPEESIGALVDGRYWSVPNVADDPTKGFRIPMRSMAELESVEVLYHSHPGGEAWPSCADMESQQAMGVPFCVMPHGGGAFFFGDAVQPLEPVGRPYRFGVTDCYALVRDETRRRYGRVLRDYPRSWGFWSEGVPMFEAHFADEGYRLVAKSLEDGCEPGDVILMRLRSKVANHCALYIGDGLILHHPAAKNPYDPTRLSVREPVHRFRNVVCGVLRHD